MKLVFTTQRTVSAGPLPGSAMDVLGSMDVGRSTVKHFPSFFSLQASTVISPAPSLFPYAPLKMIPRVLSPSLLHPQSEENSISEATWLCGISTGPGIRETRNLSISDPGIWLDLATTCLADLGHGSPNLLSTFEMGK